MVKPVATQKPVVVNHGTMWGKKHKPEVIENLKIVMAERNRLCELGKRAEKEGWEALWQAEQDENAAILKAAKAAKAK